MSPRLPILKARDMVRVLERCGFTAIRQRGSHLFFLHQDGRTTLVPVHGGEDISKGLLRQILREIQISPDEFTQYLR